MISPENSTMDLPSDLLCKAAAKAAGLHGRRVNWPDAMKPPGEDTRTRQDRRTNQRKANQRRRERTMIDVVVW